MLNLQHISELGLASERAPQPRGSFRLPPNTTVVSADGHFSIAEDIWFNRFPERLKHKAPRVWRDKVGVFHVGLKGVSLLDHATCRVLSTFEPVKGCFDIQARIQDLDREGVDKEIVFPNGMLALLAQTDLEMREWVFRIYNEYLGELQAAAPGRFYGVGFINYWEPERTAESLMELKVLGLKTFMLPMTPGLGRDGKRIFYHSDDMKPMWEAIEDSGLPICFHIGENVIFGPRAEIAISILLMFSPFRKLMGELIFGGILDRHPRLKIAFAEAGINWVPAALQDAENIQANFHTVSDWKLKKDVRSYWTDHMHASFMTDSLGLRQLELIGVDNVLWSSDYPHTESTFGYGWTAMKAVLDATSEPEARQILGGNAIRLFKL